MATTNLLDPNATATDPTQSPILGPVQNTGASFGVQPTYPVWLTDLSARGIGSDWMPHTPVTPTPTDVLTNDGITATPQAAAPVASTVAAPAQVNQPGLNGGGLEGGAGGPGADTADATGAAGAPGAAGDTGDNASAGPSADTASAEAGSADSGGADSGGDSGDAHGGVITRNKLLPDGPEPAKGDDGWASIKVGEGVISQAAMKHYGPAFLAAINKLDAPKPNGFATGGLVTLDRLYPTTDAYGHSLQDWVNGHLMLSRPPQMTIDPRMAIVPPDVSQIPILQGEEGRVWEGVMPGSHANGGVIRKGQLTGPNPPGPDTGFASLQAGEGVITRRAMDHYGPAFLDKINKLAVPKGAGGLRG